MRGWHLRLNRAQAQGGDSTTRRRKRAPAQAPPGPQMNAATSTELSSQPNGESTRTPTSRVVEPTTRTEARSPQPNRAQRPPWLSPRFPTTDPAHRPPRRRGTAPGPPAPGPRGSPPPRGKIRTWRRTTAGHPAPAGPRAAQPELCPGGRAAPAALCQGKVDVKADTDAASTDGKAKSRTPAPANATSTPGPLPPDAPAPRLPNRRGVPGRRAPTRPTEGLDPRRSGRRRTRVCSTPLRARRKAPAAVDRPRALAPDRYRPPLSHPPTPATSAQGLPTAGRATTREGATPPGPAAREPPRSALGSRIATATLSFPPRGLGRSLLPPPRLGLTNPSSRPIPHAAASSSNWDPR